MPSLSSLTIKIGLYTPKEEWIHTDLIGAAPIIAQHIDEPTGIYLPLSYQTQCGAACKNDGHKHHDR
ncbi:hypothetical protein IH992_16995, partial [Candidatus Poribacteria bacterium]|nr:hypothetical protein [Candidatus Poribacteria bacterium]